MTYRVNTASWTCVLSPRAPATLADLEIGHCMFLGDLVTNPIHVAIIADGNGIDIHHTVFRENKITVVYW